MKAILFVLLVVAIFAAIPAFAQEPCTGRAYLDRPALRAECLHQQSVRAREAGAERNTYGSGGWCSVDDGCSPLPWYPGNLVMRTPAPTAQPTEAPPTPNPYP